MDKYWLKKWYAPSNLLIAIGELGNNIYERELLRVIFMKYEELYAKNNKFHKITVRVHYTEFSVCMKRQKFAETIKALREKGIIKYTASKGRKGGHHIDIITEKIVEKIKAKKYNITDITEVDSFEWKFS
ncbi:MAG: hypothetical protein JNL24_09150 [Bacteroidia bacterium]|nr:hypothetical protein [Bacteroidia bacterium]